MHVADVRLAPEQALIAWGFDPIFLATRRLHCHDLDRVSLERPIVVLHGNFHVMTVNSAALARAGYGMESEAEGIVRAADGTLTGELREMAVMFPLMRRLGIDFRDMVRGEDAFWRFGRMAVRAGVTTCTDLFNDMEEADVAALAAMSSDAQYPLRVVPALNVLGVAEDRVVEHVRTLAGYGTDRLRMGAVKIMTDGSIQGYTARLKPPGYVNGHANGMWNIAPAQLYSLTALLHRAGIQMHIHVNGDEASELALDALEAAVRHGSGGGISGDAGALRHTLQHCQMADEEQFRRMARLGVCANLFVNHIWYYGDQHCAHTIGEARAMRMDACRSALRHGVGLAIHSDAPVTPLAPLFSAWCALHRQTQTGRVLGRDQCLTALQALRAVTMGAAYTLHLEREVGMLAVGMRADMAIVSAPPLAGDMWEEVGTDWRDIAVLGTMQDGRIFWV